MHFLTKPVFLFIAVAVLSGCAGGGIRKVATITSEPSGAKVWINGVYRGETPVEIPYNWNWFYDIRLTKPGFQDHCIRERFYAPPQHWVPLDFFAELSPVRSPEHQWRHYQLVPQGQL